MHFLVPLGVTLLVAPDFKVEPLAEAAPADVAETVRKELTPAGTRTLTWFSPAYPGVFPNHRTSSKKTW